jgi:hypothetical protein
VIGQHDRRVALCRRRFGQRDAIGEGIDFRRGQQLLALAPGKACDVVCDLAGELCIGVGEDLDGDADIGHVGEGKAEEHVDV